MKRKPAVSCQQPQSHKPLKQDGLHVYSAKKRFAKRPQEKKRVLSQSYTGVKLELYIVASRQQEVQAKLISFLIHCMISVTH